MIFDLAIEAHPRLAALSHNARALYMTALRHANDSGWVAEQDLRAALRSCPGIAALRAIRSAGLSAPTFTPWGERFHLPVTLDQAAALARGDVP